MNPINKRVLSAAALALVLPLAACGGSADDEKAAASIAEQFQAEEGETGLVLTDEEAQCLGDGFVSEVGTEKLQEYELLDDDLSATEQGDIEMSDEDADKSATVFQDCADVKGLMLEGLAGEDMPEEAKECVDSAVTDERVHEFLVALFQNDETAGQEAIAGPITECMTAG